MTLARHEYRALRDEAAALIDKGADVSLVDVTRVVEIVGIIGAWDGEIAHSLEDDLRAAVLLTIGLGNPDAAALARVALRTAEFRFARWCA